MPTLNRFPLLALWAKEAARRMGYTVAESEALGHAYAVLYAIRAAGKPKKKEAPPKPAKRRPPSRQIEFGGDKLDVKYDSHGKVQGLVGHEQPQTAQSYRKSVLHKYPPGYYENVEHAFRDLLKTYRPKELNSRLLYDVYDHWKKTCGVGRLVDLDELVKWCEEQAAARP